MADTNCIRSLYVDREHQTCAQCSAEFSGRKRKYCSVSCNSTAQNRKHGSVPLNEYRARVRRDGNYFHCETCYKPAYRSQHIGDPPNRFCSQACRVKLSSDKIGEIEALRRIARNWRRPTKLALFRNSCSRCGVEFIASTTKGNHRRLCHTCRVSMQRAAKASREARKRGCNSEAVDPILVFARDRWRCALCGVKTPQVLRGTYMDNAPELDHIIPLSLGGPHTYTNTQCACRKCNGKKSNRPLGQLLMFG